jgi:UDP-N-acetylmuramyl pentapeptide phosphotransferase/UDP-N-acetylglucosamine-1-phosphate transferase
MASGRVGQARARFSLSERHAIHHNSVPRTGGVAICAAVFVSAFFADYSLRVAYLNFVISMIPIMVVAVYEDLIAPTRALVRMLAITTSTILAIMLLDFWLPRIGIPALNPYMSGIFGIACTILIVSGVTNAFNIIDGLNGLCGGVAASAFVALFFVAVKVGFDSLADISMMFVISILTVLGFNFPKARLYFGDTGSYLFGFILSWFGIAILIHSTNVIELTFLMISAFPLTEMIFTILRRAWTGQRVAEPDSDHFHHLVMGIVSRSPIFACFAGWHNPIATVLILPFAILPMYYAVQNFDDRLMLSVGYLVYSSAYAILYWAMKCRLRGSCKISELRNSVR